ncbi:hypothetical protein VNO78_10280 [Psophocarpus tetragonolobus]|uniref:RING-type E3 ubiquitin transferase n=1 Tax=Psophocarpus tetragonolobus TaxID=3891 RepID=A0AAN9SLR6_PSOTE
MTDFSWFQHGRQYYKVFQEVPIYGLAIGAGVPELLCLIGISCFICGKVRMMTHGARNTHLRITISLEPVPFVMGLEGATIEKYPKTLIGQNCIDEWLKLNGTCPLCRNSPEASSTASLFSSSHFLNVFSTIETLLLLHISSHMVERSLRMREARGSIPRTSINLFTLSTALI